MRGGGESDEHDRQGGGKCDEQPARHASFGGLHPRDLEVHDLEFPGERLEVVRLGCCGGFPQKSADGNVERLSEGDEHLGIGHGKAPLPLRHRLPHDVELNRQLLLRKALRLPEGFDVLAEHRGAFLSPNRSLRKVWREASRCCKQRVLTALQWRVGSFAFARAKQIACYLYRRHLVLVCLLGTGF